MDVSQARKTILMMVTATGSMAQGITGNQSGERDAIVESNAAKILKYAIDISIILSVDLHKACLDKIILNEKKYPIDLCENEIEKYTTHSDETGITKENQCIVVGADTKNGSWLETFFSTGLDDISGKSTSFVANRKWQHHDTTTNLALALVSEVGELADVVAWTGDNIPIRNMDDVYNRIAQELADIIIILVRLVNLYDYRSSLYGTVRRYYNS